MRIIALKARLPVALFLVLLIGSAAIAQMPSAGAPGGINTAFVKLFGSVGAFTAKVDALVLDKSQTEKVRMPMEFAASEGKVRIEINLAQMQGKDLPAATMDKLKQAGMDRVISLFRPDKKTTYVLYPGTQSYLNIPFSKGEVEAFEKGLKLEKTALGKETIDGHACVQNNTVVKNDQAPVLQAITWNAADLKDFPVQIEMKQEQDTVRMRFTQIRFVKADAQPFNIPAAYGLMK